MNDRMPVVFFGHGSPMLALEDGPITENIKNIGNKIIERFGKPKAILCVSAHWYTAGSFVQKDEQPRQVYDMYGFPKELYQVKYPVNGDSVLGDRVLELLGERVEVNNDWGIDHGTWTVLVHAFPEADIPVVQLSIDRSCSMWEYFEMGKKLVALRDEGYLVIGSGNIVHNLWQVDWNHPGGTLETEQFNQSVVHHVQEKNTDALIEYERLEHAKYAVPTPDHYAPLLYILGAADQSDVVVFNNQCNLGSIAMTSFAFGI